MKLADLPKKTQLFIQKRAKEVGITVEEVLEHFSALSRNRGTAVRKKVFTN